MKRVKQVNGLLIMQLQRNDRHYEDGIHQYMVFDREGNEVGVGVDTLEASIEFARNYKK